MTGEGPRIEIRNLTKRFRRGGGTIVTPVDDVSLTLAHNELVVLLGPSGCGKTTLLRCVAGLERPDSGEIVIDGRIMFSAARGIFVPANRRRLSMIFQSFALWPHMNVFDNVAYPLESLGVSRADIHKRVPDVLAMVGVDALAEQYPGRISGGQQQRVALARALVANSTVILFDEPLSNVDAQVRAQLRFELKRMQQQIGFSALYVTHDQTEAMELGHRVAVLQSGRIVALDAPKSIYENPPSIYVAKFVGTANVYAATILSIDETGIRLASELGDLLATTKQETSCGIVPGDRVAVAIRPERLQFSRDSLGEGPNRLRVRLEARMFSGAYTEFIVSRGAATARIWSQDEDETSEALPMGAEGWLVIPPDRIRILPADAVQPAGDGT